MDFQSTIIIINFVKCFHAQIHQRLLEDNNRSMTNNTKTIKIHLTTLKKLNLIDSLAIS